ncbi:COG3014 family protein [Leadbettera azotonutricia]|uniref:Putative lipoprotein n=1 Tax=Leadbettera azotonutricia (strain ATCC BAA-888 / DSM 13862 / ZAS-9) TaxID=545695 RepID=F5Y6L8_LEAAZ|nr:lipoprotein [Leadbettera azotonutricia]AEF80147.1 putative lipoprotein [Leadbettera azotonutricia ZAS-9]
MKFVRPLLPAVFFFFFLSCAGNPDAYREIDAGVRSGSYTSALASMEAKSASKNIYTKKNQILFYLDRGMIEHYAGFWEESSQDLEEGERRIEEAFTKSLSQAISTYIVNDNTRDYSGEDYEDIYTNVFNAFNYYQRDDLEGALVEIRRVNQKLQELSDKYETAREKVVNSNSNLGGNEYAIEASRFSNSALARYLGVLFYRGNGNADDARIDMERLKEAFETAPSVYYNPLPRSLDEELEVPKGKGRLNVVSFTGLAPIKAEISTPIPLPLPYPNNWARLALPQMIDRPSAITRVVAELDSGKSFELDLLEDMGMVAKETFKARYSLILLKTVARTIIKSTTVAAVGFAIDGGNKDNDGSGWGAVFSFFGRIAADASEQADLRISHYFPCYARVGGINLDPGMYNLTINYYGQRGLVGSYRIENVYVGENRLNLTEFVCLE